MEMKIQFLGTGTSQGVPVIACNCEVCTSSDPRDDRTRTSARIFVDGQAWVIDTGPDFRQQMLRAKADQLDAVLLTHEHMDHITGMDDVRTFNFLHERSMPIYANRATLKAIERVYSYVFTAKRYPGVPVLDLKEIKDEPFMVNEVEVIPINVLHMNMPVLGFRIGDLTYITDANYISDEELEKIKGSKILVLNALRKEKHISHFNLQEAIDLSRRVGAERTYLTHISHYLGKHEEVSAELPEGVFLAYDGLSVPI